jgi:hypothetical protein
MIKEIREESDSEVRSHQALAVRDDVKMSSPSSLLGLSGGNLPKR